MKCRIVRLIRNPSEAIEISPNLERDLGEKLYRSKISLLKMIGFGEESARRRRELANPLIRPPQEPPTTRDRRARDKKKEPIHNPMVLLGSDLVTSGVMSAHVQLHPDLKPSASVGLPSVAILAQGPPRLKLEAYTWLGCCQFQSVQLLVLIPFQSVRIQALH